MTKKAFQLQEFGQDLIAEARGGRLSPVIGREVEIEQMTVVLCRKTKRNPVILGEPGVGKTALVEGLAHRIAAGTVPPALRGKTLYSLNMGDLLAGTGYRGDFEQRLKGLVDELLKPGSNTILFIDELHLLGKAGKGEGGVDAANYLKPLLARGDLSVIGASTPHEWGEMTKKDSALERRFQSIHVREPSVNDTILILQGLKKAFEAHHKVKYGNESIELAVRLSERYINDRFLPDKAIDVIDEAGSRARLSNSVRPDDIVEMEEEIKLLIQKKDDMVKAQEYEKAAQIRDEINVKKEVLEEKINQWQEKIADYSVEITPEDIYAVISLWTGIPLERIEEAEASKLLRMEEELGKRVVGQKVAVEKVSRAVRRSRTGFKDPRKPSGSFVFLGPTGVGKTELARALAEFLFGNDSALFRLDMSEYMEPHSISKLIGSPPGYVGYDDAGQLSEFVRRNPYSVVLFDEVEKAHPDVFNILLQILEEGTLTDTHGRKVDFRDTIVIMTSNLGAREMHKGGKLGFADEENRREITKQEKVMEELKKHFNPEFLNRIDEIISFHTLSREDIRRIIVIMLQQMNKNLFEKSIFLNMDERALDLVAKKGFDEKYGARPLRRVLQREVEDYMANRMLEGAYKEPTRIDISVKDVEGTEELFFQEGPWAEYESVREEYRKELKIKEEELKKRRARRVDIGGSLVVRDSDSPSVKPANTGQVN